MFDVQKALTRRLERLTIGVEIEFVMAIDFAKVSGQYFSPLSDIHKHIHKACPKVPLNPFNKKALVAFNEAFVFDVFSVTQDDAEADAINAKLVERGYQNWTVHYDSSVDLTLDEYHRSGADAQPVELVSRIFDVERDDWKGEISSILSALHSKFNSSADTNPYRILANESCGLHVHIGRGKSQHSFRTVQNLLQLGIAFERIIDQFHETQRIHSCDPFENNNFCRPPSYFRTVAGPMRYEMPETTMIWCEAVACADEKGILTLVDGVKHCAYNLTSYFNPDDSLKPTIEFRQHAGSLDASVTCAWMEFVITLVRFADETNTYRVHKLLFNSGADPNYNHTIDFLRAIGASSSLIKHYKNYLAQGAAKRRKQTELSKQWSIGTGVLPTIVRIVEESRCVRSSWSAVHRKTSEKLESGVYGI